MWFKRTGQEVGAPPDHRVELLPDDFKEYRRRFARGVYANYETMWEQVVLFGTLRNGPGGADSVVARYNANGTLDKAFGAGKGYVTTTGGGATDTPTISRTDATRSFNLPSSRLYWPGSSRAQ